MLPLIDARIESYKRLKTEFNNISSRKIATFLDLEAAFMDVSRSPVSAKGLTGHYYMVLRPIANLALNLARDRGEAEYPSLLTSSAQAKTQENLNLAYPKPSPEDLARIENGTQEPKPIPAILPCIAMDDFIDIVLERSLGIHRHLKIATVLGQEKKTMEVLQALRQVPDYSDYFPSRPPRNGKRDNKKTSSWDFPPAGLRPAGA